jgi:oligoribonuclease NrnB/cAMP/cGMP phosphodiesterase (DHH superfamily)
MLKPNAEQMLWVGKGCGLTWVMEAYNPYLSHYDLFFAMDDFEAQLKTLHEEMTQMEILAPSGNGGFEIRDIEIDKVLATIPRKPLVVYHKNCADGFGAMWCFWKKFGDSYEYSPGTYTERDFDLDHYRYRDVILVDFSFKRQVVEDIIKVAKSVKLIDHHKSALEDLAGLEGLDFTISTVEHSGAMLAWMYLNPGIEAPWAITLIEDRDLWKFKHEASKDFSQYLFSLEYDINIWDRAIKQADEPETFFSMCKEGAAIERKHLKDVNELKKYARWMIIGGYTVPVMNVPYMMASDAGNQLCKDYPDLPFAATYYDSDTGRHFSLRSIELGADVSKIAFEYSGGGHKHASGFKVPRDHELARI